MRGGVTAARAGQRPAGRGGGRRARTGSAASPPCRPPSPGWPPPTSWNAPSPGLGLAGALVNSTLGSNGAFLDEARFAPLLERFERLDVPLYLHPAPPSAALHEALYHGLPPAGGRPPGHRGLGLARRGRAARAAHDRHRGVRPLPGAADDHRALRRDGAVHAGPDRRHAGPGPAGAARPRAEAIRVLRAEHLGDHERACSACRRCCAPCRSSGWTGYCPASTTRSAATRAGRALLDALPLAEADKAKIAGGNAERVLRLAGT